MPGYTPFTREQREQAQRTELCALLRSQGETLKCSGSEYEWRDGAQKVTIRGHLMISLILQPLTVKSSLWPTKTAEN